MAVEVERIDHLGIIAGVIQDLKIIEMIDERISPDKRSEITIGEVIAGMIINGLGFSDRPMTLTPQFFQNKAMALLFRSKVRADFLIAYFSVCKSIEYILLSSGCH